LGQFDPNTDRGEPWRYRDQAQATQEVTGFWLTGIALAQTDGGVSRGAQPRKQEGEEANLGTELIFVTAAAFVGAAWVIAKFAGTAGGGKSP
jgi:hypothetical protein